MTSMMLARYPTPVPPPLPEPSPGGGASGKGDSGSGFLGSIVQSGFDAVMQKVWDAGVWVLRAGFELADQVSWVDPSTITGKAEQRPDSPNPATAVDAATAGGQSLSLWSSLIWLATLIALGLFFYQLISVALRGGRGMFRAFTGPLQFGMAIALTSGMVAVLLGAADGLTTFFLSQLGGDGSFGATLANDTVAARVGENPDLGDSIEEGARAMILGLAALFGIIPAAIGFALQMIFRQAAILVLVATIPLLAAMLVADSTAPSFWRGVRWLLAAILMKPALALVLLIGVSVMARAEGVAGLLAGAAVLLVSLFCPMVIYRLLAFVDPGTGAGMALRSGGGGRGSSAPGADGGTSESINVARMARSGGGGSDGAASAGGGGELGGSTAASPAAAGRAGGAGAGGAGGAGAAGGGSAAGGGAAAGGAAAGLGAVGGVAAAAVVGGYLATKAAAGAAGGYGSSQMAQTGVGHPGPAPAPSGGDIGSAARGAYAGATAPWGGSSAAAGGDNGPIEPDPTTGPEPGPGSEPPVVDPGPPEAGRPDSGPGTTPIPTAWTPEPPTTPAAPAGTDREDDTP